MSNFSEKNGLTPVSYTHLAAADGFGGLTLHQFFTFVAALHAHIFVFDFMDFSVSEQQRF